MVCRHTRTQLTQGALRAAKSLAKHIRGQDLQTLPLHSNCYQIFQLFSTKLFLFALFPLHLHIKRTIETSRKQRRRTDERRGGRDRLWQWETRGARPWTPVLMGIISFYLRQLSLHSILSQSRGPLCHLKKMFAFEKLHHINKIRGRTRMRAAYRIQPRLCSWRDKWLWSRFSGPANVLHLSVTNIHHMLPVHSHGNRK